MKNNTEFPEAGEALSDKNRLSKKWNYSTAFNHQDEN